MSARSHGLRRAAFWRALGFPNLVLARAARQRNLSRKHEEKARAQAEDKSGPACVPEQLPRGYVAQKIANCTIRAAPSVMRGTPWRGKRLRGQGNRLEGVAVVLKLGKRGA